MTRIDTTAAARQIVHMADSARYLTDLGIEFTITPNGADTAATFTLDGQEAALTVEPAEDGGVVLHVGVVDREEDHDVLMDWMGESFQDAARVLALAALMVKEPTGAAVTFERHYPLSLNLLDTEDAQRVAHWSVPLIATWALTTTV
ncbi:hypothetical protein ACFCZ3_20120 [Cellulosimicrobium cellulans]|uniref:hypothetical protein n=1 Tax=Cellulosimicrobium cellulans TaxID=1710 RepID=UPI0035D81023